MSLTLEAILIGISLVFSAFFSASEIALASLTRIKIVHLMRENPRGARHLELWFKHPNRVLNTILIGNNVSNIFASVLATDFVGRTVGSNSIAIATGVMTFLILFFSEITPKTFAKNNAESFGPIAIGVLRVFYVIFYPISRVIDVFARGVIRFMGGDVTEDKPLITEKELEFIIEAGSEEGILEDKTKEMIHNIMDIKDMSVKEVMVPRNDVTALEVNATDEEILNTIKETEFSRIPVYEEKFDNIIGILYVKDLIVEDVIRKEPHINLRKIIREPYFVPETKNIYELFKEFQKNRIHIAIVVDEYGSVAGIVTLEDILEEIVGEIRDEYDAEEEEEFVQIDDNVFMVDGRMNIHEFFKRLGMDDYRDKIHDYDTVGGFVFYLAGDIPDEGEEFEFDGLKLKVVKKDEKRIRKVRVVKESKKNEDTRNSSVHTFC